jgi:hypothetical protein
MERVTGIGGIFFKARDPERMSSWYRDRLGIGNEEGQADFVWREHDQPDQLGRTVWSLFPAETDYLGSSPFHDQLPRDQSGSDGGATSKRWSRHRQDRGI